DYSLGQKIYMYEQITSVYRTIRRCVGAENLVGSEYVADGLASGKIVGGILHENAECLSFADCSFDLVVHILKYIL
ncbi:MAG: hypothetical protein K2L08_06290, partial [Erysipelotrichaceae bacterium]|nr:hypothetical protein [Erysipelotrichaceae bacterium]